MVVLFLHPSLTSLFQREMLYKDRQKQIYVYITNSCSFAYAETDWNRELLIAKQNRISLVP